MLLPLLLHGFQNSLTGKLGRKLALISEASTTP